MEDEIIIDIYAKDGGPGGSDGYVVFTMILCDANFFVWRDMNELETIIKQEAVKASNSPRDRKDGIRMAKKMFEGRQLFSNNDIFLGRYAFSWSDVGRLMSSMAWVKRCYSEKWKKSQ